MAQQKYTYSIADDTANGKVDLKKLSSEVKDSDISTNLVRVDSDEDVLDISFVAALSAGDETTLDGLVAAHDGVPLVTYNARDQDGRQIIHGTPRPLGTYTYFTSSDDDHTDPHAVGGSSDITDLIWDHEVDDDMLEKIYLDFNAITTVNKSYVRQGDLMWEGAKFDYLTYNMVPTLTDYEAGSNTSYDLYGGYLIVPNPYGTGTITVADADREFVECTPNEFGDMPAGFWNGTWDADDKEWKQISAAPYGDGNLNLFGVEVVLFVFMNRRRLLGTGKKDCMTDDVAQLGDGIRMRVDVNTQTPDHAWRGCGAVMMYREKTV